MGVGLKWLNTVGVFLQELISKYILIENYFMRESLTKVRGQIGSLGLDIYTHCHSFLS